MTRNASTSEATELGLGDRGLDHHHGDDVEPKAERPKAMPGAEPEMEVELSPEFAFEAPAQGKGCDDERVSQAAGTTATTAGTPSGSAATQPTEPTLPT